jgi:hypothetical protein
VRTFFNLVGTAFALAALLFGYFAFNLWKLVGSSVEEPNGGLAAVFAMGAFATDAQITLLASIAAGVFLGFAAVLEKMPRNRPEFEQTYEAAPDTL